MNDFILGCVCRTPSPKPLPFGAFQHGSHRKGDRLAFPTMATRIGGNWKETRSDCRPWEEGKSLFGMQRITPKVFLGSQVFLPGKFETRLREPASLFTDLGSYYSLT